MKNLGQAPVCAGQGVKFWDCPGHSGTIGNYAFEICVIFSVLIGGAFVGVNEF